MRIALHLGGRNQGVPIYDVEVILCPSDRLAGAGGLLWEGYELRRSTPCLWFSRPRIVFVALSMIPAWYGGHGNWTCFFSFLCTTVKNFSCAWPFD